MKDKVVLFFPPYDGPPLGAPVCLLSLASPLLAAGFRVSIIDAAIVPNFEDAITRETKGALCFGISLLTGPMIRAAIKVSRLVRQVQPGLPIIFGGWHPSLLPEQTLQGDFVDVVVRGQGELTLLEIVQRLAEGKGLSSVQGVSYQQDGRSVHEPERPVENLNNLPTPAFDQVDFDAYERARGLREIGYPSSVGCPYACNYCTDQVFYKRRFNAYRAERVIREVTELVDRYRQDEVAFLDSNFPVDRKRAVSIARGFLEAKLRFRWTVQASTDLFCRMSDEEVRLLAESGLAHMGFGTESASPEVLTLMNKKHQWVEDIFETARKTALAGMRATFNVIFGYPGETEADRLQTFRIMDEVTRRYSNVSLSFNLFTPYPGLPIWPQLKALGVPEPQSLEAWAKVTLGTSILPWLQGEDLDRLQQRILESQGRRPRPPAALDRSRARDDSHPIRAKVEYGLPERKIQESSKPRQVVHTTEPRMSRRSLLTGQRLEPPEEEGI